jgi:hypothetical protein
MIQLDDKSLRTLQLIELELLQEVDRICRKCGIHYNIIAGTLLGAVRHGGFIPWDDDADVAMLRGEYERFRDACQTELDTERFYFQDHTVTPGYRWGYGKLRRKDTLFVREHQEHMPYEQGVFIDVFPLDAVPDSRAGRALVHLVLKAQGMSRATVVPVSLVLAVDRDRYIANLASFRCEDAPARSGSKNGWVEYFANALTLACERAEQFVRTLLEIREGWLRRTGFRAGSCGRQLLSLLLGTPALSIKTAQALTGKSYPAARGAVLACVEAGVLRQNSRNRKSGIYVADDVVAAFNAYERSLATLSGDTSSERPRRRVPHRR